MILCTRPPSMICSLTGKRYKNVHDSLRILTPSRHLRPLTLWKGERVWHISRKTGAGRVIAEGLATLFFPHTSDGRKWGDYKCVLLACDFNIKECKLVSNPVPGGRLTKSVLFIYAKYIFSVWDFLGETSYFWKYHLLGVSSHFVIRWSSRESWSLQ